MATPSNKPAKTLSSRLSSMKFMQRAAASSSPSLHESPEQPPTKRPRTVNDLSETLNAAGCSKIATPIPVEEERREQTLARLAAEAGDEKWILNAQHLPVAESKDADGLCVVDMRYSRNTLKEPDLQVEEAGEILDGQSRGRKSFGKFNKRLEKQQQNLDSSTPTSEEDNTGLQDTEHVVEPQSGLSMQDSEGEYRRHILRQKRKKPRMDPNGDKAQPGQEFERHKNKQAKMNRLKSISFGGN